MTKWRPPERLTFGVLPDGRSVELLTLSSEQLTVRLLTLGAAVQSLCVRPSARSVVLGYERLEGYLHNPAHLGAVVGRFANRIGGAQVTIEGARYALDANEGRHTLHGGRDGLTHQLWEVEVHSEREALLKVSLPDGHMGFPGALHVEARYQLSGAQLTLSLSATCDAPTLCNLTSHCYFNLSGAPSIGSHTLQVQAEQRLEVDEEMIPTGRLLPVAGTSCDLRRPAVLSQGGAPLSLDHHLCARDQSGALKSLATLEAEGLEMSLSSTSPGLQVYTGEWLHQASCGGERFEPFGGVALEPQLWPDAPHHPHFPSALLRPGERYENVITLGFRGSSLG